MHRALIGPYRTWGPAEGRLGRHRLILILMLSVALRLYGITNPYLDSHAERQAQVAIVARNLSIEGNPFCTKLDIFGDSGCVLLEFPTVHALAAGFYRLVGEHEVFGRLIAVTFSVFSVFIMYRLAALFLPTGAALISTAVYALSPSAIYFGRAFMAEPFTMALSVTALYLALMYLNDHRPRFYLGAALAGALAGLSKTTWVLIVVPIAVAWYQRYGRKVLSRADFVLYVAAVLLPAASWTAYSIYVNHQNAALPSGWQLESIVTERGGLGVLLRHDFYVAMGRSIGLLLLTPLGVALAAVGAFSIEERRSRYIVLSWLAAVFAYFFILAGANRGHIYYQLPLLPVGVLLAGYGVQRLARTSLPARLWSPRWRAVSVAGMASIAALYMVGYYVFFSYMYNTTLRMPYVTEVARIVREQTRPDAVLILNQPNASTTVLTYYARRRSWNFQVPPGPEAVQELERLRARGGTAYVAIETRYGNGVAKTRSNPFLWRHLNDRYVLIVLSSHYLIFDVSKPRR